MARLRGMAGAGERCALRGADQPARRLQYHLQLGHDRPSQGYPAQSHHARHAGGAVHGFRVWAGYRVACLDTALFQHHAGCRAGDGGSWRHDDPDAAIGRREIPGDRPARARDPCDAGAGPVSADPGASRFRHIRSQLVQGEALDQRAAARANQGRLPEALAGSSRRDLRPDRRRGDLHAGRRPASREVAYRRPAGPRQRDRRPRRARQGPAAGRGRRACRPRPADDEGLLQAAGQDARPVLVRQQGPALLQVRRHGPHR